MTQTQFTAEEIASETWKPVSGFGARYEVSTLGRIRSLSSQDGPRRAPKILKPWRAKGYRAVTLRFDGVVTRKFVHHVVLEAFVGLRPEGTECCHRDDVKHNNRLGNLRWDTHSNNAKDSQANGNRPIARKRIRIGPISYRPKLTTADKSDIRAKYARGGYSHSQLADEKNVSKTAIYKVLKHC